MAELTAVAPVSNGGKTAIEYSAPYVASVRIVGVSDILFHRWNCEAVDAKSKAAWGPAWSATVSRWLGVPRSA